MSDHPIRGSKDNPQHPRAYAVLFASTFAFMVCFAVWMMFGVIGIPIRKTLELNNTEFGLLTSTPVLVGAMMRLPLGIWTDRFGGRIVMMTLLIAAAVPVYLVFIRRGAAREDMQDFLEAIHRIMEVEHRSDNVERGVEAALVAGAQDFRQLYVLTEAAKNLEQAADGLMHVGLKLRDHFLGQVMTA